MQQRKLVSFKQIDDIKTHPNADSLELAVIGGWQCVVEKGKFKAKDWIIYFEIDSLIPISERFEFLRKYCYVSKTWMQEALGVSEGFRIRTIRLRGEISQGLVISIPDTFMTPLEEDRDLSGEFGVIKYEAPAGSRYTPQYCSTVNSSFPSFMPKTGETRLQNKLTAVKEMRHKDFEVTRKYHGMSITIYAKLRTEFTFLERIKLCMANMLGKSLTPMYTYGVCSHNVELNLEKDTSIFTTFAKNSGALQCLKEYVEGTPGMPELAIQGELCGPGIQDNHHGLDEVTVYIFNIFDIKENRYLLPKERWVKFEEIFGIANLPFVQEAVIEYIRPVGDFDTPSDIISLGEFLLPSSGKENEGLVWKAMNSDFSFKAISNNFLLNHRD